MVNLTDLWKAAGSPRNQKPAQWRRLPLTGNFVEFRQGKQVCNGQVETRRGQGGGTYATPDIALAYVQYLSPKYQCRPDLDVLVAKLQGKPVSKAKELVYQGFVIRKNTDGMVNLTDMWRAVGSPEHKKPYDWMRLDATQELAAICGTNTGVDRNRHTLAGGGGGTWVIPNLAIAYAKYLSPHFHAWANQAVIERMEEELDPELGVTRSRERAVNSYRRQGKSDAWIERRMKSVETRVHFTGVLCKHGVEGRGYSYCTNAIYRPILGQEAREAKATRGLKQSQNLRDNFSAVELAAVALAETLSEDRIKSGHMIGNDECERACHESASSISLALVQHRRRLGYGNR